MNTRIHSFIYRWKNDTLHRSNQDKDILKSLRQIFYKITKLKKKYIFFWILQNGQNLTKILRIPIRIWRIRIAKWQKYYIIWLLFGSYVIEQEARYFIVIVLHLQLSYTQILCIDQQNVWQTSHFLDLIVRSLRSFLGLPKYMLFQSQKKRKIARIVSAWDRRERNSEWCKLGWHRGFLINSVNQRFAGKRYHNANYHIYRNVRIYSWGIKGFNKPLCME